MSVLKLKKKKLTKTQQMILIFILFVLIILAFSFLKTGPQGLSYQTGTFSKEVVSQITKKTKAKNGIYVTRAGFNNGDQKNFSIELAVPKTDGTCISWYVVYNEDEKVAKENYQVSKYFLEKKKGSVKCDIKGLPTLSEAFSQFEKLEPKLSDIFEAVAYDGYLQLETNYDYDGTVMLEKRWKVDEKKKKIEQEPVTAKGSDISAFADLTILKEADPVKTVKLKANDLTASSYLIYTQEEQTKAYARHEILKGIVIQ